MPVVKIAIHACVRCRHDHIQPLEFLPLDCPNHGWTHYALCPINKQPIMMSIAPKHDAEHVAVPITQLHEPQSMDSLIDQIAFAVGWDKKTSLIDFIKARMFEPVVFSVLLETLTEAVKVLPASTDKRNILEAAQGLAKLLPVK